ncbi:MAG TPA: DUF6134 family protein [Chitinophagaceae bacterium]|nr:DUF6134 family protein [Chitinophagaceae bacterium]
MIYAFIIWLIREYRKTANKKEFISLVSAKIFRRITVVMPFILLVLFLLLGIATSAQTRRHKYEISRGDRVIGTMLFSETKSGGVTRLNLVSEVNTGFILPITGEGKEEAVYQNGLLVKSAIMRRQNGKEKMNKHMTIDSGRYLVRSGESQTIHTCYPISYNMLALYAKEPVTVSEVFSDRFGRMIPIRRAGQHRYKIELPDGSYNYYSYVNGVLEKVEVHQRLYTATIQIIK